MNKSYFTVLVFFLVGITVSFLPGSTHATALFAFSSQENFSVSAIFPTNHNIIEFDVPSAYKIVQQSLSALLPPEVDIDALDFINPSTIVFSLREDAVLPGVGLVANEDLLLYNGSVISLLFDGSANGLPPETDIDAVDVIALSPSTTFSFSLREDATLPGISGLVSRNDAIRFQGGAFTGKDFDGVARGVPAEANLDAFSRSTGSTYVISLNAGASLSGTLFGKADLVQCLISGGAFSSFFNAAANGIPPEVNIQDCEADAGAVPVELSRFYSE